MKFKNQFNMNNEKNIELKAPPKSRLILGGIVFISGFLSPLLIPVVISMDLSTGLTSIISGILALGIPEVFMVIAVAIMGKSGFQYLKEKFYGWFKKHGPPDRVSLLRYRIGLIMFSASILLGFILPYIWEKIPLIKENLLLIIILFDVNIIISVFILGGDFWDKIRSLYIYNSKVVLIKETKQDEQN
jgi:hypothetical protein